MTILLTAFIPCILGASDLWRSFVSSSNTWDCHHSLIGRDTKDFGGLLGLGIIPSLSILIILINHSILTILRETERWPHPHLRSFCPGWLHQGKIARKLFSLQRPSLRGGKNNQAIFGVTSINSNLLDPAHGSHLQLPDHSRLNPRQTFSASVFSSWKESG